MKIEGWAIEAFGPLQSWTVEGLAGHPTIVVLGDNETGKSALFEFLTTALFGFSPATADGHPFRPWDGRFLAGAVQLRLRDGRAVRVSRRLTSRPEGAVEVDGQSLDIANRPVDWVGNLGRQVFTNIHALTQKEALQLDARAWQQVEDRLLGGASFDFLRPAREVVDALDSQRRQLWRSSRRGKPLDRALRERLRTLRQELAPALQRRSQIEMLDARLAEIDADIGGLRNGPEGLQSIELALERDTQLAPLLRRARRLGELSSLAANLVPADDFSNDPRQERDALQKEIASLDAETATLGEQMDEALAAQDLDERTRTLMAHRGEIERLHGNRSLYQEDVYRIQRMDRELQRVSGQRDDFAARVLDRPLDASGRQALLEISEAELRGRFAAWSEAGRVHAARVEDLRRAQRARTRLEADLPEDGAVPDLGKLDERLRDLRELEREEAIRARGKAVAAGIPRWALAIVATVGIGLAIAGVLIGATVGSVLLALGLLTGGAAALALVRGLRRKGGSDAALQALRVRTELAPDDDVAKAIQTMQARRDETAARHDLQRRLEQARHDEDEARDQVGDEAKLMDDARDAVLGLLQGIPVAPIHLERPTDALLRDLEDGRQSLDRRAEIEEDRADVAPRVDAWRAQVLGLRDGSAESPPDDPLHAMAAIFAELAQAVRAGEAATAAAAALPKLRERLELAQVDREAVDAKHERLEARLRVLDPGGADALAGLDQLDESRSTLAESRRIRADLDRESPGWSEQVAEAEKLLAEGVATEIELTSERRVALRAGAEEMRKRIEELADERGSLTTERKGLMQATGPAHVQGAIEEAEEERRETQRAHDRLSLLSGCVREAERRYREAHQSPLLSTASGHLAHITSGRYDLLTVDESGGEGMRMQVHQRGVDFLRNVDHPLSRGTLQQIYLALRLAMIDQVEAEEPLPVFLDEMFVNWDPHRTARGVEILGALGQNRQVFLFTTDPRWAQTAAELVQAHILTTPTLAS